MCVQAAAVLPSTCDRWVRLEEVFGGIRPVGAITCNFRRPSVQNTELVHVGVSLLFKSGEWPQFVVYTHKVPGRVARWTEAGHQLARFRCTVMADEVDAALHKQISKRVRAC